MESRGIEEGADARTVQEGNARHNEKKLTEMEDFIRWQLRMGGNRGEHVVGSWISCGVLESPTFNLGGAAGGQGWRAPGWPIRANLLRAASTIGGLG